MVWEDGRVSWGGVKGHSLVIYRTHASLHVYRGWVSRIWLLGW